MINICTIKLKNPRAEQSADSNNKTRKLGEITYQSFFFSFFLWSSPHLLPDRRSVVSSSFLADSPWGSGT